MSIATREGKFAVMEAIEFLTIQQSKYDAKEGKPLPPLRWDERVAAAAKDHVEDIGPKGLIGHESSYSPSNANDDYAKARDRG